MRRLQQILFAAALLLGAATSVHAQTADIFEPYKQTELRLPSVPLLLNDPYFSLWSPHDKLTDGTTRHWTDIEKPMDGLLRVDGVSYRFMGSGRSYLLTSIAPMANEVAWEGRVSYERQDGTAWAAANFDDSSWETQQAAWGTPNEYPNVKNPWTATNSDIYIRRTVNLTAEDLKKDLWIQFSHDDVFELYINGTRVVGTGETWIQGETHQLSTDEKRKLRTGENVIAAHCHNTNGGAYVDFGLFENTYNSADGIKTATQKSVDVLATNTYYTFACGPVELDLVFTAPMIITDLDLVSTPINFISYQVRSTDGAKHDVQFYFATTPVLTINEPMQAVDVERITENGVQYLKAGSNEQRVLGRVGDLITIDWGYLYIPNVNGEVSFAGTGIMENTFAATGKLPACESKITNQAPANMTTLAYSHDFGSVQQGASYMMIGYDEVYDIRYFGKDYKGYWARNGKTITQAFDDFHARYDELMQLSRQQDKTIYDDALAAGNVKYAELLSGSYRQVLAAHKLFEDDGGRLLYFSKENNSNGCVNTVDLTYPSAPLFLMYNTDLQKGMMTSIFEYSRTGRWNKQFAAHDLGTYPHANGQVYGGDMPLEESGNMLTLAAMICMIDGNTEWIEKYWNICTTWVAYLVKNGQDPAEQLCTDDFAGHWAHNANLSIKAIMAVAAYAQMARMRGSEGTYNRYMETATKMAQIWEQDACEGDHYRLAYDRANTWGQKYNLVWDKLWGTYIFPNGVIDREIAYYLTRQNAWGLPLDSREKYSKSDWIFWTASMADDTETFLKFSDPIWKWVNETTDRIPLSDWYYTDSKRFCGFRARSVIGGFWMKVLMDKYAPAKPDHSTWAPRGNQIRTRWAAQVNPAAPLPEYPRPQLVRQQWQNLNGLWNYAVNTTGRQPEKYDGQILVPFAIESSLSGVNHPLDASQTLWYSREFTIPADWQGKDIILNFGAVDYNATVYVNGQQAATHSGGFGSFSVNITDKLIEGTNTLVVKVVDKTDPSYQPVGKQRLAPGLDGATSWNNAVSGIWQTVWMEPVEHQYITRLRITPDVDKRQFSILAEVTNGEEGAQVAVNLSFGGQSVAQGTAVVGQPVVLTVASPKLWSPSNPALYDLDVTLQSGGKIVDHVTSYAALRKISTAQGTDGIHRIQLNNSDLFQIGVIDQGYWPDGLYTAPTDSALLFDLLTAKELGFNLIRKHQKVEPDRWYYYADSLGLLVWQDMPALGRTDEPWVPTAWTTTNARPSTSVRTAFQREWREIIAQLYSHPSIIVWTPFDEAVGQFQTSANVELTRNADATRLIDAASGGNHKEGLGDFVDLHDDTTQPTIFLYDPERPVVLGACGGFERSIDDHRWYDTNANVSAAYSTELRLTNGYANTAAAVLALATAATSSDDQPAAFSAAVYRQLYDVGKEVNGLLTYDREVVKVSADRVRESNDALRQLFGGQDGIIAPSVAPGTTTIYDLSGRPQSSLRHGVNILRLPDGKVTKLLVK